MWTSAVAAAEAVSRSLEPVSVSAGRMSEPNVVVQHGARAAAKVLKCL
jgi:hypothetical protein